MTHKNITTDKQKARSSEQEMCITAAHSQHNILVNKISLAETIIIICPFGVQETELIYGNVSQQNPRFKVTRLGNSCLWNS